MDGPTDESIWVQDVRSLLMGTEKRWRSIKVMLETWLPLYELMEGSEFTHLPSLESASIERANDMFSIQTVIFDPEPPNGPMRLFGGGARCPSFATYR